MHNVKGDCMEKNVFGERSQTVTSMTLDKCVLVIHWVTSVTNVTLTTYSTLTFQCTFHQLSTTALMHPIFVGRGRLDGKPTCVSGQIVLFFCGVQVFGGSGNVCV